MIVSKNGFLRTFNNSRFSLVFNNFTKYLEFLGVDLSKVQNKFNLFYPKPHLK